MAGSRQSQVGRNRPGLTWLYTLRRGKQFTVEDSSNELRSAPSPGLCACCRHQREVRSGRSAFLRCALADFDQRFARYPRLPVTACAGFEEVEP